MKKIKERLRNVAVWVYVIANAITVAGSAITFMAGNEVWGYILAGSAVVVNVIASLDNPDFEGFLSDKKPIITNVERAAEIIQKLHDALEESTK